MRPVSRWKGGQLRLPSLCVLRSCAAAVVTVVSAVCNDRFFIWFIYMRHLAPQKSTGCRVCVCVCVKVILVERGECSIFIQCVLFFFSVPTRWTHFIHWWFWLPGRWKLIILFFVCRWCIHFFIFKQWCTWNQAAFPRNGSSGIGSWFFFFFFYFCVWEGEGWLSFMLVWFYFFFSNGSHDSPQLQLLFFRYILQREHLNAMNHVEKCGELWQDCSFSRT